MEIVVGKMGKYTTRGTRKALGNKEPHPAASCHPSFSRRGYASITAYRNEVPG